MDKEFALNHAPNSPLVDGLEHYRRVGYANIDQGRWYYMTYDDYNDLIVEIEEKHPDHLVGQALKKKLRYPGPEDPVQWTPLAHYVFLISPAMMEHDGYKFYEYVDDQNVEMTGGRSHHDRRLSPDVVRRKRFVLSSHLRTENRPRRQTRRRLRRCSRKGNSRRK